MQKLKKSIFGLALTLCATLVLAQPPVPPCDAGFNASLEAITIDLTGIEVFGVAGDAENITMTFCNPLLADAAIDSVAWTGIDITPNGASWCSEPGINFVDAGITLSPGSADGNVGPCTNGYEGEVSLTAIGLTPFAIDAGGCIVIEFIDSFEDNEVPSEATFTAGTVSLFQEICVEAPIVDSAIPTMGEWGLMCLGILFLIIGVVSVRQKETQLEIAE